jgi:hypothetical protein
MKRTVLAVVAGLVFAPGAASATTICAPSDPAGYYACASVSIQWNAGNIVMSVQNLDTWDLALAGVVGGYRLYGHWRRGRSVSDAVPDGRDDIAGSGCDDERLAGDSGHSPTTSRLFTLQAGTSSNRSNELDCRLPVGGQPEPYWNSCGGPILFTFGTDGLTEAQFNTMAANGIDWGMRGISGPNGESFRCFDATTACRRRRCLSPSRWSCLERAWPVLAWPGGVVAVATWRTPSGDTA